MLAVSFDRNFKSAGSCPDQGGRLSSLESIAKRDSEGPDLSPVLYGWPKRALRQVRGLGTWEESQRFMTNRTGT